MLRTLGPRSMLSILRLSQQDGSSRHTAHNKSSNAAWIGRQNLTALLNHALPTTAPTLLLLDLLRLLGDPTALFIRT